SGSGIQNGVATHPFSAKNKRFKHLLNEAFRRFPVCFRFFFFIRWRGIKIEKGLHISTPVPSPEN
ncbi:MAG: hypothetical protein KUG61_03890, partial [Parvibaculaceae bacterium]|nr:hypothetical protein [Parvibaculaceae bacterium]